MTVSGEVLLDEIAPDLVAYLKEGTINPRSFVAKALSELSSSDLDRLLRIHFVLTETDNGEVGVIDFVAGSARPAPAHPHDGRAEDDGDTMERSTGGSSGTGRSRSDAPGPGPAPSSSSATRSSGTTRRPRTWS